MTIETCHVGIQYKVEAAGNPGGPRNLPGMGGFAGAFFSRALSSKPNTLGWRSVADSMSQLLSFSLPCCVCSCSSLTLQDRLSNKSLLPSNFNRVKVMKDMEKSWRMMGVRSVCLRRLPRVRLVHVQLCR